MKEQSAGAQSQDSDATSNASDGFLRSWTARYCTLHPGPSRATRVIRVIRVILAETHANRPISTVSRDLSIKIASF